MSKTVADSRIQIPAEYYDLNDSDNVCHLCETPSYHLVYNVTHYGFPFKFQQCQCGLVKQTPMPNERFFEWFFNSDIFLSSKKSEKLKIWGFYDFYADELCRLATSQRRYKMLHHLFEVGRPLKIMKIGPATGTFLHVAQQHGHHAIGSDVSSQFVEYAKKHYNVRIDHGRFERMNYADNQFDIILLLTVLENIPNLSEFFEAIRRTLNPAGYFILNFVDMERNLIAGLQKSKYFLYRPPVCYIYTKQVLEEVLRKFGFEIVEQHRDIRYLHLEKIVTLLGWKWPLILARFLKIHQTSFPIYAYPSKILVAR